MARIRSIKPEFFESRTLASCSRDARLVFAGLFTLADDHGKLKDLPKKIVGELFPHDDDVTATDMNRWLDELSADSVGCIIRYEVDGERLIFIPNFEKHQLITHKGKSRLPDPSTEEEPSGDLPQVSGELRKVSGDFPEDSRDFPQVSGSDLGSRILDLGSRILDLGSASANADADDLAVAPPDDPEDPPPKKPPRKATSAPANFEITDEMRVWAVKAGCSGLSVERETEKFLDYYRSRGTPMKDWLAAWRNWIRKSVEMHPDQRGSPPNDGLSRNPFFRMIQEESAGQHGTAATIVTLDAEDRDSSVSWNLTRALGQPREDP